MESTRNIFTRVFEKMEKGTFNEENVDYVIPRNSKLVKLEGVQGKSPKIVLADRKKSTKKDMSGKN